jgi:hypothetical protein
VLSDTPAITHIQRLSLEWVNTGSMVSGRRWHGETVLLDGKVLICGGDGGGAYVKR